MEIVQNQNHRSEQILLLLITAFAVLPRNPISDQRSSMAGTEGKKTQKMPNTESPKNPNKSNQRKKKNPTAFHHIKLYLNFSTLQGPEGMS